MFVPNIENLAFIRGLLASGLGVQEIADYLECHRNTVTRWKRKIYENPQHFLMDAKIFNGGTKNLSVDEIENI